MCVAAVPLILGERVCDQFDLGRAVDGVGGDLPLGEPWPVRSRQRPDLVADNASARSISEEALCRAETGVRWLRGRSFSLETRRSRMLWFAPVTGRVFKLLPGSFSPQLHATFVRLLRSCVGAPSQIHHAMQVSSADAEIRIQGQGVARYNSAVCEKSESRVAGWVHERCLDEGEVRVVTVESFALEV